MDELREVTGYLLAAERALNERHRASAEDAFAAAMKVAVTPRLAAAAAFRWGSKLRDAGRVQDALLAFELALSKLAIAGFDGLDLLLDSLKRNEKTFSGHREALAPDVYDPALGDALSTQMNDEQLAVDALFAAGNAYLEVAQPRAAEERYRGALARKEIKGAPLLAAEACTSVAVTRWLADDLPNAKQMIELALRTFPQTATLEKRRALAVLGGIERARKMYEPAGEAFSQAIALYVRANDRPGEARTRARYGHLLLDQQRRPEALGQFRRALELAKSDSETECYALWGVSRAVDDLTEASRALKRCSTLILERASTIATDEGKVAFLATKESILQDLLRVEAARAVNGDISWENVLAMIEESRGNAMADLMAYYDSDRDVSVAPIAQSAMGVPTWVRGEVDEPPEDPPRVARLVFGVLSDRTVVISVSKAGQTAGRIIEIDATALAKEIERLRLSLGISSSSRALQLRDFEPPAGEVDAVVDDGALSKLLIANAQLPAKGERLYIEPTGPLWLVPFAVLTDEEGVALGDRHPLIMSPSLSVLAKVIQRPRRPRKSALVCGNPDFPPEIEIGSRTVSLSALEGAEEEARAIAARLDGAQLFLEGKATIERVVEVMPGAAIVHFATHGYADDRAPLESFVALAGGTLTARKIMKIDLHADLVVLSACQTGLGQITGDGVVGLARAVLAAGARTVIASLWSVGDGSTKDLMIEFYDRYVKDGDKAAALQGAMIAARKKWPDARSWGAFILLGAPE